MVGAWLAVDMTMGSGVKFLWQYFSPGSSFIYLVPLAAGVVSGEVRACPVLALVWPGLAACMGRSCQVA